MFYDDLYFNVNAIFIIPNYEFHGNYCLIKLVVYLKLVFWF